MSNIVNFPGPSAPCDTEMDDRNPDEFMANFARDLAANQKTEFDAMAAAMAGEIAEEQRLESDSIRRKDEMLDALSDRIRELKESIGLDAMRVFLEAHIAGIALEQRLQRNEHD